MKSLFEVDIHEILLGSDTPWKVKRPKTRSRMEIKQIQLEEISRVGHGERKHLGINGVGIGQVAIIKSRSSVQTDVTYCVAFCAPAKIVKFIENPKPGEKYEHG